MEWFGIRAKRRWTDYREGQNTRETKPRQVRTEKKRMNTQDTLYPVGNIASSSSSVRGRLRSSISRCQVHACICSGVIDITWPGVGVAIAMAFDPVGVVPDGVNALGVRPCGVMPVGVNPPGVSPLGVRLPGVRLPGVVPPGVVPPGVDAPGVSSHLDRRLLAPGVGVSWIRSPPVRSARGVSAQPLPWPGVSVEKMTQIIQILSTKRKQQ